MVKLTGWESWVLFVLGRVAVMTSEYISVWFSVSKKLWPRRLSILLMVMKTAAAEPDKLITHTHTVE